MVSLYPAYDLLTEEEKKRAGLAPYCPCGSGECREAQHDARGIFLCYTCPKCHKEKMRGFRPEVLSDPQYEADEPIEPEDY